MAPEDNNTTTGDQQKRKLCRELALILKAESIVDGFLTDTKRLELPPEWQEAVAITRRSGEAEKLRQRIRKTMQAREYREIEAFAKKDAEELSLREIGEGKMAEH
ncbi:hypothetical protein LTR36_008830 [Oleoguttula mirabilis]|uniref:Uncharacterized protein n=1 Tax=Oleoguttula mirabilis TaxID=1507867 RepID=A0AAV9J918_9PEZI|nr:hypothetical protein LTR36_008830 [Oleoguttula mirabilis]